MSDQPLFVPRAWYHIGKPTANPRTTEKRQPNKKYLHWQQRFGAEHEQVFKFVIVFVTALL